MTKRALFWSIALLLVAALVGLASPKAPADLPRGFDSPVMALYMAADQRDVEQLVPPSDTALRTRWDWFLAADLLLIFTYARLFSLLAGAARDENGRRTRVSRAGAILPWLTAIADLGENVSIVMALHFPQAAWPIRPVSLTKWTLLGLTAIVLCRVFFTRPPLDSESKLLRVGASVFYATTAIITLFGLFDPVILERVTPALGVSVLLHTLALCQESIETPV